VAFFDRMFAPRCTPHLSHLDEPGAGILNVRCYMWWDTFPSIGLPDDPHLADLHQAAFESLQNILAKDWLACRESALHGLGHWHGVRAAAVHAIIDGLIAGNPQARPELLTYAHAARTGCILQRSSSRSGGRENLGAAAKSRRRRRQNLAAAARLV
jgi:hypothetical protein